MVRKRILSGVSDVRGGGQGILSGVSGGAEFISSVG